MPAKKLINIPSTVLHFEQSRGLPVTSPTNTRVILAAKLLGIIRRGEKTIPESQDNAHLIRWIQSSAHNNIVHMIWYLQQAARANQIHQSKPAGKADIWASSSIL